METFKTVTTVKKNHKIEIENVPFENGMEVEIEVSLNNKNKKIENKNYILRDKLIKYDDPYKPVAEDDWEVLK
jgi:hypothetical protein